MKTFACIILLLTTFDSIAQINTLPSSGKVGIGTTNPQNLLNIQSTGNSGALQFNVNNYPTQWGTRLFTQDCYNGACNGVDLALETQYYDTWYNAVSFSHGQDIHHPSLRTWYSTYLASDAGSVGIGTTLPSSLLQVGGGGMGKIVINSQDNNWGQLQIANPSSGEASMSFTSGVTGGLGQSPTYSASKYVVGISPFGVGNQTFGITNANLGNSGGLYMTWGGNFGIGTTTPTEKFSVNGNIKAKKLIVAQTGWADYVFKPAYKLRSLSEVEQYIKIHQHLPDILSEEEVKSKGIDVGETQAMLLRKIEELTLYVIELKKECLGQQKAIKTLKKQIDKK